MAEDDKDYELLEEQVKEKPISRRKRARWAGFVIMFAVLFGAVAAFVFTIISAGLTALNEESLDSYYLSDDANNEEHSVASTYTPQQIKEEIESEVEKQMATSGISSEQSYQDSLYDIGQEADCFIAMVTGVSSDRDWFDTGYQTEGKSSGIIIKKSDNNIMIVTSASAVSDAEDITVSFCDGTLCSGKLKGRDESIGLAVIKVDTADVSDDTFDKIKVAPIASKSNLSRGDIVIAVGAPSGIDYSVLTGNISTAADIAGIYDGELSTFSTDITASTLSNGAILNSDGEVIGIIKSDITQSGASSALGAIVMSDIEDELDMLCKGDKKAFFGVKISTVTQVIAEQYSLPEGAYVYEVAEDSPAMNAGLQKGDVIVKINGTNISNVSDYEKEFENFEDGSAINVTLKRMGANHNYTEITCTGTIGEVN